MKINSLKIVDRKCVCDICNSVSETTIQVVFSFGTLDKHDRQAGNHKAPYFDSRMIKNYQECDLDFLIQEMKGNGKHFKELCQDCFEERINTTGKYFLYENELNGKSGYYQTVKKSKGFSIVKEVGSRYSKVFFPSVGRFVGIKTKKENELFKLLSQCDDGRFSGSERAPIVNALKALPEVMALVDH
jgi:hypothetical protein